MDGYQNSTIAVRDRLWVGQSGRDGVHRMKRAGLRTEPCQRRDTTAEVDRF